MKYSNLNAFQKHVEGAAPSHFSDLYLILAKESFVRRQAQEILVKWVLKNEVMPELSLYLFDAERHPFAQLIVELETIGFLSKKRLIVVQNAEALDKDSTVRLESYFLAPNPHICLVLSASTLNRATNFYKKAEKAGIVLDIPEEKSWEKEKNSFEWLQQVARELGRQLIPAACQLLVKQLGTDQSLLYQELQKLICYVGDRKTIEERDVSAICISVNLENAWQLGEAIFNHEIAAALRISKALLNEGGNLIALLRQIRAQFQTEAQICSILQQGGSASEISKEFSYMKGAILERHMRQAQSYGMKRLTQGLIAIDEAELQAKNSSLEAELLTDILMVKLASR